MKFAKADDVKLWQRDASRTLYLLDVRTRAELSLRRMLDLSGGWRAPTDTEARLEAGEPIWIKVGSVPAGAPSAGSVCCRRPQPR